MSWLDAFLTSYNTVQSNGEELPQETILNFGSGFTVVDDVAGRRTTITASTGGPMVPTTMLTSSTSADLGVCNNSGVTQWYDQAPARAGQYWSTAVGGSNPATYNATGLNGLPSIDFSESVPSFFEPIVPAFQTAALYLKPDEFTLAVVLEYTGTKNAATSQICPLIFAATNNNPVNGVGLSVGLDPGNSANVIFAVFVNDSNGASSPKYVQSASVPKNVGHYVVATFLNGTLSLYLDALSAVTVTGVGNMTAAGGLTLPISIGNGGVSTSQRLNGHVGAELSWCRCLSSIETTAVQAYLQLKGGL